MSSRKRLVLAVLGLGCAVVCAADDHILKVPKGDILNVQIERDSHMRVGETVRARTVYPLYVDNRLAVPAGAELEGKIVALQPAQKKTRRDAKLGGDFTPLHTPRIQFERIMESDGTEVAIRALPATGGVEVVRFQAMSAGEHQSLTKKLWAEAVGREKETVRTFTAPGKKDRARRMLYAELPYHPELLTAGTQFEVELAEPVAMPTSYFPQANNPTQAKEGLEWGTHNGSNPDVTLAAELVDGISSQHAVRGTKIKALVTEPLFGKDGQLKVPQGSILLGEITQAQSAGKWGKGGVLRFSFRELQYPAGFVQKVHGAPVAVDSDQKANIQLDAEGGAKPGPKGVAAPLVMGLLAVSAVHEDEVSVLHTGGASNGFALIGRVAALAAKSNYVGAAFGFYGTGRAVYGRWLAHGEDVKFPKHTRIEVMLGPEQANALQPK